MTPPQPTPSQTPRTDEIMALVELAVMERTVKLREELQQAQRKLEKRMLESKLIEHILDNDVDWGKAIPDQVCPTMQSAIMLRSKCDSLQRANGELQDAYDGMSGSWHESQKTIAELSASEAKLKAALHCANNSFMGSPDGQLMIDKALSTPPADALKPWVEFVQLVHSVVASSESHRLLQSIGMKV